MFFRKKDRLTLEAIWARLHLHFHALSDSQLRMEQVLMSMMEDVKAAVDALSASMAVLDGDISAVAAAYEKLKSDPTDANAKAAVEAALEALTATKQKADADHANLSSLAAQSS